MSYAAICEKLLTAVVVLLALGTLACLVRAILGPSVADRLVAANMVGTQVIAMICLLAAHSGEDGFADVAIVYALLSFLAAAVLTKILSRKEREK